MSRNPKPRRRYRPRRMALNTIALAMHRASRAPAEDIQAILQPIREAFRALREGVASELQWSVLASSVNVAMTIEAQGVVRGLAAHLKGAEDALQQIYLRAMSADGWTPTPLHWQEIDAIDEYVPLHRFQLEQLSRGEMIKVMEKTTAAIRSVGGKVIDVSQLPKARQLELIGAQV